MIGGVNDTDADADAMAELLRGDHAHVNLIPMNPVAHTPWTASPMPVIERFAATLRDAGIATTIRRNRGQEIGAACGQLAAERAGEPPAPAVARRRARLVAESAAALRGERSHEPVAGRGGGVARGRRSSPGRREHPRRRPRQPRLRGPARRAGRRRPDPPRRHGRPLRPEPDLRREDDQGASGGGPRCPFDAHLMIGEPGPLHRRVPRRRLRLDHLPRRDRGADRADARARSAPPVGRPAWRSSRRRRCRRSSRTASCSTS